MFGEDGVQVGALDAAGRRNAVFERIGLELGDQVAGLGEDIAVRPAGADRQHFVEHADAAQGAQGRPGNGDAGAVNLPVGVDFGDGDRDAAAA